MAADSLVGGLGDDTLRIATAGVFSNADFSNLDGIEVLSLTGASNVDFGSFANDAGIATVVGGSGNSTYTVGAGFTNTLTLIGGAGNDDVDGSASTSEITFYAGANDTFLGGSGNDDILFGSNSDLASSNIDGGAGTEDTIEFTAAGTLVDSDFTDVANIEVVRLFGATTATFNNEADDAGISTVYGGSGASVITQGVGFTSNFDFIGQGDADSVTIQNAAQLANDDINGGLGTDTLTLGTAGTYANTDFVGISNMDVLVLTDGTNDVAIGGSGISTVYGGTGGDDIDASAYGTAVALYGGAGNTQSGADTLTGGSGGDWLQGWTNTTPSLNTSNDTLTGGTGSDTFVIGDVNGNAYGQAFFGDPGNTRAYISDFTIGAGGDVFQLSDLTASGAVTLDFTNAGALGGYIMVEMGGDDVYRINYTDNNTINAAGNITDLTGTVKFYADIDAAGQDFRNMTTANINLV